MKIYKNGDRCPCCGQLIEGKSEEWLNDFSMLVLLLACQTFALVSPG